MVTSLLSLFGLSASTFNVAVCTVVSSVLLLFISRQLIAFVLSFFVKR